jgi:signal transduction histidine kinase
MEAMVNRTIASTRRISSELRPLILDDLGLAAAIEWLTQSFSERTGIDCSLDVSDPEPDLHDPLASAVFRIVQESLTNAAKHAKASQVNVELKVDAESVLVKITDDGVGFVMDNPRKPDSYGLLGLRERAYLLGGEARIHSEPGRGTDIEVRIPLQQEMLT